MSKRGGRPLRFALTGRQHAALKAHLFPGDGREAVAFAVCGKAHRDDFDLLTIHEVMPVAHSVCLRRTANEVVWPGSAIEPVLLRAMKLGMSIIKIHSHPGGYPEFSEIDNVSDATTFEAVFAWLDTASPQASFVMLPDGTMFGRRHDPDGVMTPIERIRLVGDDFVFWPRPPEAAMTPDWATRVAQTFGDATYGLLRQLRVGVVGASGTGSVVIELLARNMVGELVVVDPDVIEHKNLNRILNSTAADASSGAQKTAVQLRAIEAMRFGTKVHCFPDDLLDLDVLKALSTCDVLFGCMDSVDGRHVLNKLASAYLIPLIDLGVRLDADGHGGIDSIWSVVHTVLPGGSSLFSRGVYSQKDLDAAFLRRGDPEAYERQLKAGYVKGAPVDRPAVISVNMDAAAAAVNEFLARLHPYRAVPNSRFAVRRTSLSDPDASFIAGDGQACEVMGRMVGIGDRPTMLNMPLLESSRA